LDCELLREVYINLTEQKEPSLIFQESNNFLKDPSSSKKPKQDYLKIVIKPTEEEKINHKNYLKQEFKKNYF